MSLRRFLNVAFAILIEEYQRMGVDLISALEKVSEWAEGASVQPVPDGAPSPSKKAVVRQNEEAIALLQGMKSKMVRRT